MLDDKVIKCAVLIKKIAEDEGYFSISEHARKGKYLYVSVRGEEGYTTQRKLFHFDDFKEEVQKKAIEYAKKYYGVRVVK